MATCASRAVHDQHHTHQWSESEYPWSEYLTIQVAIEARKRLRLRNGGERVEFHGQ